MALINALLVRSQNGWSERLDAASIVTNTRFEAYLALGAVQTEDGVNAYADAQLDIYANPREEVVAGIAPIGTVDLPYVGYRVGDTVTVPNSAGTPTVQRVRGITVTEDDDTGIAVYTPQFKDLILQRAEQVELVLKKMSNGTLSGSSMVAQPIREQFVPREVVPSDAFGTVIPIVVVASDGSGDFTSIKSAIEAQSNILTSPITILVKPGTYSDAAAGAVTMGNRNVLIMGGLAESNIHNSSMRINWTVDGFTISASCGLTLMNIKAEKTSGAGQWCSGTKTLNLRLFQSDTGIYAWFGDAVGATTIEASNSTFTVAINTGSRYFSSCDLWAINCILTFSSGHQLTMNRTWYFYNCILTLGADWVGDFGNNPHSSLVFVGCDFNAVSGTMKTDGAITVDGCWSDYLSGSGNTLTIEANKGIALKGALTKHNLTVAQTGAYGDTIEGSFYALTINGSGVVAAGSVHRGSPVVAAVGLTVNGDNNIITVTTRSTGSVDALYNTGADNNKSILTNFNATTDNGAGNTFL